MRIAFTSEDRDVDGDLACDVGHYELTILRDDAEESRSRGKFATVWKRGESGRWRIHVDSFSPAPP